MLSLNFVLERALLQNTGGCLARRQILYKSTAATSYQVQPTGTFYESGHLILRSFLYRMLGKIRLLNGRKSKISKGERVGMILILRFGSSPDENRKFQKGERVGMILISSLFERQSGQKSKISKVFEAYVVSSRF